MARFFEAGAAFEAVADLCALSAARDPRLKEWTQTAPVWVAACHPRAVRWLLAAAQALPDPAATVCIDLRGAQADQLEELALPLGARDPEEAARMARAVAAALEQGADAVACPATGAPEPAVQAAPAKPWDAWFPVIDFERCTQCMQCLSFCLFGVFGVNARREIEVSAPASCKTNCPACARVCPESAILFPKHASGPVVGGELKPPAKVDLSALLGGDVYGTLRERRGQARQRFSMDQDPGKALEERQRRLAQMGALDSLPPEVLRALPPPEEIQRLMAEAKARAGAVLDERERARRGEAPPAG